MQSTVSTLQPRLVPNTMNSATLRAHASLFNPPSSSGRDMPRRAHSNGSNPFISNYRKSVALTFQTTPISTIATASRNGSSDIVEVKDLLGIRLIPQDDEERPMRIEYLVEWKDGSPNTWEPITNLADNLLRDYEERWWGNVRKGNEEEVLNMLKGGGEVLARTVEDGRRSALHFAAALGKVGLVQALLDNGAEVDLQDKEGYTPLHMAAGYMHTSTISALLAAGADPEQQDRQGRSPLELVESLRAAMPATDPSTVARRVALEDVLKVLTDNLFEDVDPDAVLDARVVTKDDEEEKRDAAAKLIEGDKEYLIKFPDEEEPVWIASKYVSTEVVEDYESGLEYAKAEAVIDVRNRGDSRTYLVKWQDDYPDSWEPEENVSLDLIKLFEEERNTIESKKNVAVGV